MSSLGIIGEQRSLEDLRNERYVGKFWVTFTDGRRRVAYFLESLPRNVIKIDGEHTYYWYRDSRLQPMATLIGR